jgi:uncharacterized protein YaiE (UPF0345 family)
MTTKQLWAAFALACSLPAGLLAEETRCTGQLTGSHDNVVVPQGAICSLVNAQLNGSVLVYRGGGVTISGRTYINGNVISEDGGAYVRISGPSVTVGGNVQIKYNFGASAIQKGTVIHGSFQYVENTGPLFATGAFIGSDFQLFNNSGGASISNNTIRQNMQCKENTPAPTGGGNRAGDKEDQCSGL